MDLHFWTPKILLFPQTLAGTIARVQPSLRVFWQGTSWQAREIGVNLEQLQPCYIRQGQVCQIIGRQGITLLIQLPEYPLQVGELGSGQ
ncbi:MAG: hypothetical protein F6J87_23640 [Spirulina sp. SIO3F2]|nr:hypothetical protein [Spirulina sp. SIO3F2]